MYRMAGYLVRNLLGDPIQYFTTRSAAMTFCNQNGLPISGIKQLFEWHKLTPLVVDPAGTVEPIPDIPDTNTSPEQS